ncbi:MAG TPA: tetratricopeptide repeat protein [Anaerolineae bacterium]|nr:tetratricopeptide repeat protein [Anaerolineae bacterium]HQK14744.1 tetratricopeptide repeat protein [Anaerolineae bacterium]
MKTHLAQAHILLQTRRYKDAEAALRRALAAAPNDADAHILLALALYYQDRNADALREVHLAIGLAPEAAHAHYVRALILLDQGRPDDAMRAIHEALRLDPNDAAYHVVAGRVYLYKKDWKRALAAAEAGLQCDPQHITCRNLQAMALVRLGRKVEALDALTDALARAPENALTHANYGWALLHQNKITEALAAFREALRLDPTSSWAREGIVEALKARNFIYRLLLRYFLWMSRLTEDEQWGVIGIFHGIRVALRMAARAFPPLWIIVLPLLLLYQTFALLTWVAKPLFALLLRFDRFGRLALSDEDMVASTWMAICLLAAELGVLLALLARNWGFLALTVGALALLPPVAGVFHAHKGVGRLVLAVYTGGLALLVVLACVAAVIGQPVALGFAALLAAVFIVGWMVYTWVASLVIIFQT